MWSDFDVLKWHKCGYILLLIHILKTSRAYQHVPDFKSKIYPRFSKNKTCEKCMKTAWIAQRRLSQSLPQTRETIL